MQVVLIDVALAGDNAVVVGALAAGLPEARRKQVILIGIAAAFVLRVDLRARRDVALERSAGG